MKNSTIKLIFMFLITTFSLLWISEKLAVFLENEKYSYVETSENTEIESKLKTLFMYPITLFDLDTFSSSKLQNINSSYFFNVKEFSFESLTPPPELM